MSKLLNIPIVVAAASPAQANAWSETLRGHFASITEHPTEAPPSANGGILVTDSTPDGAGPPPLPGETPSGWFVIRIGTAGPADVFLPAEFAPRELLTACRLLAEIAALRAELGLRDQQHRWLVEQALSDSLTGLWNRRAWEQTFANRMNRVGAGERLCLAIVDLDHFKLVNDHYGHPVGDDVLSVVGKALRESLRQSDLVARLGGDEFGLLLELPSAASVQAVVERVRTRVAEAVAGAGLPRVTASVGYCTMVGGDAPALPCPDVCVAAADAALRRAKQQGRDRSERAEFPL